MQSLISSDRPVKASSRTRKPQERTARLMQLGGCTVLALTCGTDTTFYRLETLLADAGRGFRLVKADQGDGPGEEYDVRLDGPNSTCECRGFLRHGMCKDGKGCKHIAGLAALVESGKV